MDLSRLRVASGAGSGILSAVTRSARSNQLPVRTISLMNSSIRHASNNSGLNFFSAPSLPSNTIIRLVQPLFLVVFSVMSLIL